MLFRTSLPIILVYFYHGAFLLLLSRLLFLLKLYFLLILLKKKVIITLLNNNKIVTFLVRLIKNDNFNCFKIWSNHVSNYLTYINLNYSFRFRFLLGLCLIIQIFSGIFSFTDSIVVYCDYDALGQPIPNEPLDVWGQPVTKESLREMGLPDPETDSLKKGKKSIFFKYFLLFTGSITLVAFKKKMLAIFFK